MLLKGKSVFVIEDDPSNLAIIRTILLRHGAVVPFDAWGSHTVQRLRDSLPIDVILLDLALPRGVSGFDIADEVRSQPDLAAIPIVVVSASDPSIAMNQARARGLNGFISKPIKYNTFAESVAYVLQGNTIWDEDPTLLA